MTATAIIIRPDSTRLDLLDEMAREVYGIADPDASLASTSDAYRWRWAMDEMVQQMSEEQFRDALEYIARAHDVNVMELDSVACAIMDALGCTADAAQGMREWVFDAIDENDNAAIKRLESELNEFYQLFADLDELNAEGYTIKNGTVYEIDPVEDCEYVAECDYFMDASFGVLLIFR